MSIKGFFRKLIVAFGVLMLFLAIDVAVAWYFYPQASTPAQAVKMEATHAALEIIAKTMRSQIKKDKSEQTSPASVPTPAAQPPKQPAPRPAPEAQETPQAQEAQPQQQTTETTTRVDDVQTQGNNLVYTIVADANGQEFDYVMQQIRAEIFPADCSKPEYSKLMEYGVGVTLDFHSQDGTKREQIIFTPQTCGFEPIPPSQEQAPQQ